MVNCSHIDIKRNKIFVKTNCDADIMSGLAAHLTPEFGVIVRDAFSQFDGSACF